MKVTVVANAIKKKNFWNGSQEPGKETRRKVDQRNN